MCRRASSERTSKPPVVMVSVGPIWSKHRIALDFNMVGASDREVWEAIPSKLQSFRLKGGVAKSGRWFSWNEQCAFHLPEYHACKMMFDWYFPGDTNASDSGLVSGKLW